VTGAGFQTLEVGLYQFEDLRVGGEVGHSFYPILVNMMLLPARRIAGLLAWEFVYNEESGLFSREPNHNWASHPSDGFAYGTQVMTQFAEKEQEKPPKFPVTGHNGRIVTISVDELWNDTSKRTERY